MQLNDPFRIGVGHDVSLFPEKRTVTPFDLKDNLIDNFKVFENFIFFLDNVETNGIED